MAVGAFLDLINAIIKFLQLQKTNRKEVFDNIVKPLFDELQPVVDDYFKLFRDAKKELQTGQADVALAAKRIRERREALLIARVRVREMADAVCLGVADKYVRKFASHVVSLFFCTQHDVKGRTSGSRRLVDLCDMVTNDPALLDKAIILAFIDRTLEKLESDWLAIAQSFGHAKIRLLKA